jgi:hypothetical protein
MARRTGRRDRRRVAPAAVSNVAPISAGHRGVACAGDPLAGGINTCPRPATSFLLGDGAVAGTDGPRMGLILIAFCDRHEQAVKDFVLPKMGPHAEEAIVAEIAALPAALESVGIHGAHVEGLPPVVSNVFGLATG